MKAFKQKIKALKIKLESFLKKQSFTNRKKAFQRNCNIIVKALQKTSQIKLNSFLKQTKLHKALELWSFLKTMKA